MASSLFPYITPEQYLAIEREAEFKSEYIDGVMYPRVVEQDMAGGLPSHSELAVALGGGLRTRLRGKGCRVFSSDLRIGVARRGPFFYPDLSLVWGEILTHEDRRDVLMNPLLMAEITSKSSVNLDRGMKFAQYRRILIFSRIRSGLADRAPD